MISMLYRYSCVLEFWSIIKINLCVDPRNCAEKVLDDCRRKIQPFIIQEFGRQNKSTVAELFTSFFNQVCFGSLCMGTWYYIGGMFLFSSSR